MVKCIQITEEQLRYFIIGMTKWTTNAKIDVQLSISYAP